jgi:hypothetical protein
MWTELQLWTIDGLARDAKHNGNFVLVDSGSFEADGGHQFIEIVYDVLIEAIQWLCYCCLMLTTTRLRLRLWRDEDLPIFASLNSDPRVMQYMAKL